jgi:membrane-associated phospholipid phosphatase
MDIFMLLRKLLILALALSFFFPSIAQDSNFIRKKHFPVKSFVVPGIMISYGFIALGNHGLKSIDEKVQEEIWTDHAHKIQHVDTYLQFLPAFSVYMLNIAGIRGKNNFRDITMIYLLSNIFLNSAVYSIKNLSHRQRPDLSDHFSFPSGHTAEAFASAELLRQEYKDVSAWYGIAGYLVAATTGYLRMYDNKHWLSDVIAGAGIGMASAKLAYWLYPKIKRVLFKGKSAGTMILPVYQNNTIGVSMVHQF